MGIISDTKIRWPNNKVVISPLEEDDLRLGREPRSGY